MKRIASMIFPESKFGPADQIYDADELSAEDHKLLILHGGADIATSFYGEKPEKAHSGFSPSKRDIIEFNTYKRAVKLGIPVLGICRGAQLVCVANGGSLYQDVPFHAGENHQLHLRDDQSRKIVSNSYHHQMMIPGEGAELLAWCGPFTSERWKKGAWHSEHIKEPEVVYWPEQKTLAVQGHPEWDNTKHGIYMYTVELLNKYFDLGI